jgi:YVTN family beta-propeller protein
MPILPRIPVLAALVIFAACESRPTAPAEPAARSSAPSRDLSTDALTATGEFAYVLHHTGNHVTVIDVATHTVAATVIVGTLPTGVAFTPDGSIAYVTNAFSGTVSAIDVATHTVTTTIDVGPNPYGVAITPDGSVAYVTHSLSNAVSVIDVATHTVTTTIDVGNRMWRVAFSPDGSVAYVTTPDEALGFGNVVVIDVATHKVTATVDLGVCCPFDVAFAPDGSFAYVTNVLSSAHGPGSMVAIDVATHTVAARLDVSHPVGVAFTPDGSLAWVANTDNIGTDNVSVVHVPTHTVTTTKIDVGPSSVYVAFTSDGSLAYVTDDLATSVWVIDVETGTVAATVDVGSFVTSAVAITPANAEPATPEGALTELAGAVEALQVDGDPPTLNNGQAKSLLKMIDRVVALLERGLDHAALNKLDDFIEHVDGLVNDGVLSEEQSGDLISAAEIVKELIEGA